MEESLKTLSSLTEAKEPSSGLDAEACLSDDDILAFVQGHLIGVKLEGVHTHVDQCEVCQQLVAEAAHGLDAGPISDSSRSSWNTVFQQNAVVGKRYRIRRLIARGGMGEVYEAYDSVLHERLALKTVTATASDNHLAVRYLKAEVQHARRISHPNVCRIYDFGTHVMESPDAEIHFLAMEFIDGDCLGKRLREFGALPLEQALSIAHQLLLGLGAAHQAGILHRDFKSDNVMLRSDSDGVQTAVILDFGLAKALNESGNATITQLHGHSMVGTLGYMAPEQIEGEPLSIASDLYAFGVVWFEMLTGRLPFVCDSPAAAAMARLHRTPVAPSSLNPKLPKWLDQIVLRCLCRHREGRFESAEQIIEALAVGMDPKALPWFSFRRGRTLAGIVALGTLSALGMTIGPFRSVSALRAGRVDATLVRQANPSPSVDAAKRGVDRTPSDGAVAQQPPSKGMVAPSMLASPANKPSGNAATPPPRRNGIAQAALLPKLRASTTARASVVEPATEQLGTVHNKPDWLPIWSDKGKQGETAKAD